ncbi:MAG: FHA domain-containing protein [Lachnospiraceae bacterium]
MKKNKLILGVQRFASIVCMIAAFLCFTGITVHATEGGETPEEQEQEETTENTETSNEETSNAVITDASVISSRTTEDAVYIYIKGMSDITSGTTVQIGNTLCEDIQVAGISSTGMPIKTTILFDNSQSLSGKWGDQAKELINGLIDNHAEGEEFRILTFADTLTVVSDFSAEYDALKGMVDGIEYCNQNSYLSDNLYELLKQSGENGEANYTRYIIITDGADDNDIKYTQTELADLMKVSGVVIHTVGVKASNNNELLETLFSFARYTSGTYHLVDSATEVEAVRAAMDEDYAMLCMKLVPEASVMDGSRREAKFSLNSSNGTATLTYSLQMPFADVSALPAEETVEEEAAVEPSPSPEPSQAPASTLPSISSQPQAEEPAGGVNVVLIIIIAVVVVAVIAAVVVVLIVMKNKKKKQADVVIADRPQNAMQGGQPMPNNMAAGNMPQGGGAPAGSGTLRLTPQGAPNGGGNTMRLQGANGQAAVRQTYISLTDIASPQRTFRVPIDNRIVIGRESGDIVLGFDGAVSHTHCEILKKGNLFYVNDLKSSNGTFYGGSRVYQETPIMNGGVVEIGSYKYKITIEN